MNNYFHLHPAEYAIGIINAPKNTKVATNAFGLPVTKAMKKLNATIPIIIAFICHHRCSVS